MSAATVTYHELPPMSAWATEVGLSSNGDHHGSHLSPFFDHSVPSHSSPSSWTAFSNDGSMHTSPDNGVSGLIDHNQTSPSTQNTSWCCSSEGGGPLAVTVTGHHHSFPSSSAIYAPRSPLYPVTTASAGDLRATKKRLPGIKAVAPGTGISYSATSSAPEELCLVCGDKASGYHYNALTCEGCKGFFRRSITRKAVYYCKYGGHCDIDMYMRRKCQCCRLRKCMDIGMRPERLRPDSRLPLVVIPEDQCRIKREAKMKMRTMNGSGLGPPATNSNTSNDPGEERKASCSPQQVTSTETGLDSSGGLTPEQRELVHRLVLYQQQYDMPSNDAIGKLSTFSNVATQQTQPFQHLAELTILTVQLIVEFTKHLPGFLTLNKEDQLTLLKACSTEVLMLRTARRYDSKTDTIVLGNQSTSWAYNREAYKQAGIGSATDAIFDFARSMTKMRVDNAEYALLTAVAIFSDRPGLTEPRKVEDIQEVYTSTLQAYIDVHRPKNRTVFARLLMKLTDLRTLGSEHADILFALKLDNGNETAQSQGVAEKQASRKRNTASNDTTSNEAEPACTSTQSSSTTTTTTNCNRVPNVRIKVEPLQGGSQVASTSNFLPSTSSNGYTAYSAPLDQVSGSSGAYLLTSQIESHGNPELDSRAPQSQYQFNPSTLTGDVLHEAVISTFPDFQSHSHDHQ